jgi:Exo-beta-D-glucosaminidase Ig-fold domain/Glycosyl hydrolase 2 galactose-binding domain-like/NedA-like, galactose-binding domain/Glycosyl hydrolases family 2
MKITLGTATATILLLGLTGGWAMAAAGDAEVQTRGVGVYPGDPREDFAPTLVPDATTYRNLAFRRPALQSSAYDYNLTAQLVTDGIKERVPPRWVATTTSEEGLVPKPSREFTLDHNATSGLDFAGPAWIQFELGGGAAPLQIDRIQVEAHPRRPPPWERKRPRKTVKDPGAETKEWGWTVSTSDDGKTWTAVGHISGQLEAPPPPPSGGNMSEIFAWFRRANPVLRPSIPLSAPQHARFYRVSLDSAAGESWALAKVTFFDGNRPVEVGGPYRFSSAWMSEGAGTQWVSVDLGAPSSFDRVSLSWIRRAAEGTIQASDDGETWRDVQALPAGSGTSDDVKLAQPASGRYVRILMTRPASPEGYVLSELEVWGRGGLVPLAHAAAAPRDGRLDLAGGGWRVQRDSLVHADGLALSEPGFQDDDWVIATVPGTVLSSYWNAGALPDPNFGDDQLAISDSFFYADFWYRTEFQAPAAGAGQRSFLNFDGVNWKAEVYLNGEKVGRVEGGFMRGRFDVTGLIHPGKLNALAVRIEKNATPGSVKQKTIERGGQNGGALGADNPTYHASIGWDWIPTVRGRNIGLWNDVYVSVTGPVTVEDPFVETTLPLPDTSRADVMITASLVNHESRAVSGTLRGSFGDATFAQAVELAPDATRTVVLGPSANPTLRLSKPRLWWPNGYGDPDLYDVTLEFVVDGQVSDTTAFKAGVRQFTYSEDGGALRIWINGRRFVGRGGNWGFPETNLRYRRREYDVAVRLHRDMNFTMIRNWVGQTGDDEFYEACDRYGIVVWQDFWLANPYDGPDPDDDDLFLRNVRDTVLRIRNHPSLGLYCGRNEGDPPPTLERGIRSILADLDADIHYIPHSANGPVSGGGPYWAEAPRFYFEQRATPKLHSELGMPNIVNFESLQQMMPKAALWPQGLDWGLHDFNLDGAQRLAAFRKMLDDSYGGADNAADWVKLAQFINYTGYRAMFEAQGKSRMGMLLWMSHPAWPSFVWQTYDYYFDPTAGYFGSRKGSEPLHIQWNPTTDQVEVVNYSAGHAPGLMAHAEILNMDGVVKWEADAAVDSQEDSVVPAIKMEYPAGLSAVHFIRLRLMRGDTLVSDNFYWRGTQEGNYKALRTLPKVKVEASTRTERHGKSFVLTTELSNAQKEPALMVRLEVVRAQRGDRVLPALFSDNYVALMPGERRTIRTEIEAADARGEEPRIAVEGFNVDRELSR